MNVNVNIRFILGLIVVVLIALSIGMVFPILISTYSPYYGSIAKHIFLTNNWEDLILSGKDWLDKPHVPFWLTALSFNIFGLNSFAYIIPGFLFYVLGAIYTYKISQIWYDKLVSLIAVLFYFTSLHLMLSSIDVRAEAYLVGEIMPACYYLIKYEQHTKIKFLFLVAFFSALAMMTKGIFVLVTIFSGLVGLSLYRRKLHSLISFKIIILIVISFIFVLPELFSLYQQFDLHPEKVVFGVHHFSGIRWFFWDSQFGRFFNTGPIMTTKPMPYHWIFFLHTFLWAFLPWWPIFFVALWGILKHWLVAKKIQDADIYLLSSFFFTFILFSATSFQVDHYTNIIFPFACIICAKWVGDLFIINNKNLKINNIYFIELFISIFLLLIVLLGCVLVLHGMAKFILIFLLLLSGYAFILLIKESKQLKILVFPTVAMSVFFIFAMCVNGIEYAKYDAGYQIALNLNKVSNVEVVGYKIELMSLDFYSRNPYILVSSLDNIKTNNHEFFLVTTKDSLAEVVSKFPSASLVNNVSGCRIETFLRNILNESKLRQNLDHYVIIKVFNK